eukprot:scaffold276_cov548-Prasinococcus_capsulatus_cf.AAC.25
MTQAHTYYAGEQQANSIRPARPGKRRHGSGRRRASITASLNKSCVSSNNARSGKPAGPGRCHALRRTRVDRLSYRPRVAVGDRFLSLPAPRAMTRG